MKINQSGGKKQILLLFLLPSCRIYSGRASLSSTFCWKRFTPTSSGKCATCPRMTQSFRHRHVHTNPSSYQTHSQTLSRSAESDLTLLGSRRLVLELDDFLGFLFILFVVLSTDSAKMHVTRLFIRKMCVTKDYVIILQCL